MDTARRYNIALVPTDNVFLEELKKYSQAIAENNQSIYLLGDNSTPHVSLIHFHETGEDLSNLWRKIQDIKESTIELNIKGFYFNKHSGAIWHGLAITPTKELVSLQKKLSELVPSSNIFIDLEPQYFPHFTLGSVPEDNFKLAEYPIDFDFTESSNIAFRLCLGRFGVKGQLEEILYE